jgi:hypothetical protein
MNAVLPVAHYIRLRDLFNADSLVSQVMGRADPDGIYCRNEAWFREHKFCWFKDEHFKSPTRQFGKPEHVQSVKLTGKVNERVSIKPDRFEPVGHASALYHAILKENEAAETRVIVKIFMR